ncbi:MAG TPA: sigma-70 family RNA polymerase sigma factor [Acidimicrobiales bacterium]
MWSAPDDILLAGYATSDPEAATAFIRRHQRRVYGLAVSIVVDAVLAEDIAQEAFTRAWRHASTYDPRRGSVLTWLLTITRNVAIDAVRIRRARPVDPEVLDALDLEASSQSDPAAAAELGEDAVRLKAALASLPEQQRRALVLAGLCGRTAQEISDSEGIPLGTAKTRIRTGLIKLRALLTPDITEPEPEPEPEPEREITEP